jgi:hypothetical protein
MRKWLNGSVAVLFFAGAAGAGWLYASRDAGMEPANATTITAALTEVSHDPMDPYVTVVTDSGRRLSFNKALQPPEERENTYTVLGMALQQQTPVTLQLCPPHQGPRLSGTAGAEPLCGLRVNGQTAIDLQQTLSRMIALRAQLGVWALVCAGLGVVMLARAAKTD